MKKTGLVLFVLLFAAFTMSKMSYAKEEKISYPISLTDGKDAAGKVVFEDSVFLEYLRKAEFTSGTYEGVPFDFDEDGFLSARECELVRVISLNGGKELHSLNGLEAFPKLRELYCGNTKITELNLSNNLKLKKLDCHNTELSELSVAACTALEYLDVHGNRLTSLDLSKNQKLTYADVSKQQRLAGEYEKDGWYYVKLLDLDSSLDIANVSQVEIDGAAGDGINSDYKEAAGEAVCSDFIKELSYEYQTGWQDAKLAVTLQLSLGIRRAYDSRGEERVPAQYYQKGEIDIAPKIPKKEGFDFKGWYSDEKCEGQAWIFGKAVTAPSILYAKWEKSVVVPEKEPEPEKTGYQIYLDSGDEIVKSEETFSWNEKELPIYDEPTKTGYRFDGWFTAKEGGNLVTEDTMYATVYQSQFEGDDPAQIPILYAHFHPIRYTIFYRTGKGTAIKQTTGVLWGSQGILPKKKPKRKNYQFVGWKSVSTGKWITWKTKLGQSVSDGTEENIFLKAVWIKQYEKWGKRFKRYGIVYKITQSSRKKCTVKVVSKKRKKRKVPKKVFYNGRYYKVTR